MTRYLNSYSFSKNLELFYNRREIQKIGSRVLSQIASRQHQTSFHIQFHLLNKTSYTLYQQEPFHLFQDLYILYVL